VPSALAVCAAALALAGVGSTIGHSSAGRLARVAAAGCSPGNHAGAAVRGLPEVYVNGHSDWKKSSSKFLKAGDRVTTDDDGSATICLHAHSTSCVMDAGSLVRIQPKIGVLLRAGPYLGLTCFQLNTKVQLSRDKNGYYLPTNPKAPTDLMRASRSAETRRATITGDPVFSIRVRKGQAILKVRQGVAIVTAGAPPGQAVVAGRNQQVVATAGRKPSTPGPIKLAPKEKKVFAKVQQQAPQDPRTPPEVALGGPSDRSSVRSATLAFSSPQGDVTFSCALDSTDFRTCTSPVEFPRLDPGFHDFAVKAVDSAGDSSVAHHQWTIDGSRIVFESFRDGNPELYVEDPDGQNQVRLTDNTLSDEHPDWSPDQKQIVFDRLDQFQNLDIWTINADGSGEQRLTTDRAVERNPSWSPDGTRIAFERGPFGDRQIDVMNVDGTGETPLTADPQCSVPCQIDNLDPAWSPDGTKIVFASTRDGNYELYVLNANGTGVTRLTDDPANDFGPSWSPDGTSIAFHSNRNGSLNIYTMNPDGTDVVRVTQTDHNDSNPSWAPDSEHLVFASDRGGGEEPQLYVVDALTPSEPVQIPAPSSRANFAADW